MCICNYFKHKKKKRQKNAELMQIACTYEVHAFNILNNILNNK